MARLILIFCLNTQVFLQLVAFIAPVLVVVHFYNYSCSLCQAYYACFSLCSKIASLLSLPPGALLAIVSLPAIVSKPVNASLIGVASINELGPELTDSKTPTTVFEVQKFVAGGHKF